MRRRKFTARVLAQITQLLEQGASAAEIASTIGCTVGSLRVTCSQLGISLRRRTGAPLANRRRPTSARKPRDLSTQLHQHSRESRAGRRTQLTLLLPRGTLDQLRKQSATKGVSDTSFAARLLEAIVRDNLYEAVLDEAESETGRRRSG